MCVRLYPDEGTRLLFITCWWCQYFSSISIGWVVKLTGQQTKHFDCVVLCVGGVEVGTRRRKENTWPDVFCIYYSILFCSLKTLFLFFLSFYVLSLSHWNGNISFCLSMMFDTRKNSTLHLISLWKTTSFYFFFQYILFHSLFEIVDSKDYKKIIPCLSTVAIVVDRFAVQVSTVCSKMSNNSK